MSFTSPLRPQGNITLYTITRSTPSSSSSSLTRTFNFSPSTLPGLEDEEEGVYSFNDTGLLPFTNYSYILTVCNGAGCSDSPPASELTLEDTPTGVAMPTVFTVSSGEILIQWVEPSMPNGEILMYDLLRLSLGFDDGSIETVNCCEESLTNSSVFLEQCSQVTTTQANDFNDDSLRPFSFYRYCIVASNGAGSAASNLSLLVQTSPASMPQLGPTLNATTINSTAIFLQWGALEILDLLGPLDGYTLYVRLPGDPLPGEVLFQGLDQTFTATGLRASTEYVFTVEVSNGVGSVFGNNASATTDEGGE